MTIELDEDTKQKLRHVKGLKYGGIIVHLTAVSIGLRSHDLDDYGMYQYNLDCPKKSLLVEGSVFTDDPNTIIPASVEIFADNTSIKDIRGKKLSEFLQRGMDGLCEEFGWDEEPDRYWGTFHYDEIVGFVIKIFCSEEEYPLLINMLLAMPLKSKRISGYALELNVGIPGQFELSTMGDYIVSDEYKKNERWMTDTLAVTGWNLGVKRDNNNHNSDD